MKNQILILSILITTLSCSNEENHPLYTKEQVIGRWEAIESTETDIDGNIIHTTYGPNGDIECAYTIGLDYSSGFDLMANDTLDLIWYSINKQTLFPWSFSNNHLIINRGSLNFTITNLEGNIMDISDTSRAITYKMARLE